MKANLSTIISVSAELWQVNDLPKITNNKHRVMSQRGLAHERLHNNLNRSTADPDVYVSIIKLSFVAGSNVSLAMIADKHRVMSQRGLASERLPKI
jgi:hypothetical protein